MPADANTLQSLNLVGMKEQLFDRIFHLEALDTPIATQAATDRAANSRQVEWEYEPIADVDITPAAEGDRFSPSAPVAPTRIDNACQILSEQASVSGTSAAVDSAGDEGTLAYQSLRKGQRVRRNVEAALTANNAKVATEPREMGGLATYCLVGSVGATGQALVGDGSVAIGGGTPRALSVALVNDAIADSWTAGGNPTQLLMHITQKKKWDLLQGETGVATAQLNLNRTNRAVDPNAFVMDCDLFRSSTGQVVAVVLDRYMPSDLVYALDWSEDCRLDTPVMPGRNYVVEAQGKDGDADDAQIIWEGTGRLRNPLVQGVVADLS